MRVWGILTTSNITLDQSLVDEGLDKIDIRCEPKDIIYVHEVLEKKKRLKRWSGTREKKIKDGTRRG